MLSNITDLYKNNFIKAVLSSNKELYTYIHTKLNSNDLSYSNTIGYGGDNSLNIDLYAEKLFIKHLKTFGNIYSEECGFIDTQSDFDIIKEDGYTIRSTHNPFVKDRVNNVNRCLKQGLIEIDPSCKKLINDLEKVSWKDNNLDQKTDPLLTHISDCLGYACYSLIPRVKLNLKPYQGRR